MSILKKPSCWIPLGCLSVFIIVPIVGITIMLNLIGPSIKKVAEEEIPKVTGTTFSIKELDIGLLSGSITIDTLELGNPEGFAAKNAFETKQFSVNVGMLSFLSDTVIVDEFILDKMHINCEFANDKMNLIEIQKNVDKHNGTYDEKNYQENKFNPKDPKSYLDYIEKLDIEMIEQNKRRLDKLTSKKSEEQNTEETEGEVAVSKAEKKLIIKLFRVDDAMLSLKLPFMKKATAIKLQKIELNNVGENCNNAAETFDIILNELNAAVMKSVSKYIKENSVDLLKENAKVILGEKANELLKSTKLDKVITQDDIQKTLEDPKNANKILETKKEEKKKEVEQVVEKKANEVIEKVKLDKVITKKDIKQAIKDPKNSKEILNKKKEEYKKDPTKAVKDGKDFLKSLF